MLQWNCVTVLQCNSVCCSCVTVTQFYSVLLLQCFSVSVLQCNSVTIFQCYSATELQCSSVTVVQCYSAALSVLQCYSVCSSFPLSSEKKCASDGLVCDRCSAYLFCKHLCVICPCFSIFLRCRRFCPCFFGVESFACYGLA